MDLSNEVNLICPTGNFQEDIKIKRTVDTKIGIYTIDKLIGEGGYGSVYSVTSIKENKKYAMKIEKQTRDRRSPKLKMEVMILKKLLTINRPRPHFVKMYDRCKKNDYFLIVMDLLGPNLFDLKKRSKNFTFSESTAFNVAIQCLESLEDLHKFNYIHRDIKPANFAVGIGDDNGIVYLIDFGLARYILNGEGSLKTPREACKFKGTIRYASLSTHKGLESGTKDDVEAWIYMFIEFLPQVQLPWMTVCRLNDIMKKKQMIRKEWGRVFNSTRFDKLRLLLDYVDSLTYANKVDYNYIYGVINGIASDNNIDLSKPLDWTVKKT
uniref:Protein kinase domain-containing protein n=1 Tax=Parastrongyloides trichosuri TaxID=131310 RepID=A0A0N4Z491_PARTI